MKFSSFSKLFGSAWRGKNRNKRGAKPASARRVHLRLEQLEDRTVMSSSILPAPVVTNPTSLATNFPLPSGTAPQSFDPQIAVDPLNHLKMVEVNVALNNTNRPDLFGTYILDANYSTDGGQSWHALGLPGSNNSDPNTGAPGDPKGIVSFDVAQTPSIAFDRAEQFYIVSDQHAADFTSGAIVLEKFSFSSFTPTQVMLTPPVDQTTGISQNDLSNPSDIARGTNILYRWESPTAQDAAYNPTVAVDTNVPTYTDPKTGQTQTDTMANLLAPDSSQPTKVFPKAVYVAWNTNFTEPVNSKPATVSRIMVEGSPDGGLSFSTVQNVSARSGLDQSAPQVVFTQPSADGTIKGGQLTFVWSTRPDPTTNVNPPSTSPLNVVSSQQDGGVAAAPAVSTQDFTGAGGAIFDAAGSSTKSQTWTLAKDVAQGDKSLTVTTVNDTNTNAPPPNGAFTVTINNVNVTITGTSGTLWTIGGTGAPQAFQAGQTVTFTPNSSGSTPTTTPYFINVAFSPTTTLGQVNALVNDLDVTVNLTHPNLSEISIVLRPPPGSGLKPITLVENHLGADGKSRGDNPFVGLSGANMGNLQTNSKLNSDDGHQAGTVFDDQAERNIADPTASAPYVGHFRPETGQILSGPILASLLSGKWELDVTDFVNSGTPPIPPQYLTNWSLHFTGVIGTTPAAFSSAVNDPSLVTGTVKVGTIPVTSSPTNVYTQSGVGPYGAPGVGPGAVAAVDATLGGLSPYQGRIYIAYTGGGGIDSNIYLIHSDNGGQTWSTRTRVNSDSAFDNFSEGNRSQFLPSITVDPTNGNVIVTYYDGRNDASHTRVANSIAVSNDGGATFSPISYLNPLKQSTDFLTGNTVTLEPVPGNQGVAGSGNFGFGDRAGVVAFGGNITPVFASNFNAAGSTINTAQVTVASGPRVISGTMGPITSRQTANGGSFTFDTAVAADGTQGIDGFVVTFDRPVDIASFLPGDVFVQYQDPNSGVTSVVPLATATPILALDSFGFGPHNVGVGRLATTFYIKFAAAQFKVGTYSYAIGPTIQDDIRLALTTLNAPVTANTAGNTDTITVTSNASNAFLSDIPRVPFVIQIDGEQMLVTNTNGTNWTVQRGYNTPNGSATPTHASTAVVSFAGNQMDQNAIGGLGGVFAAGVNSFKVNSLTGAFSQDMFAAPTPINGVPFQATYDPETLPLIIPGPHVISTFVPGEPTTSDNLVLNSTNGALDILFDRDIKANTFTIADILSITGPTGQINLGANNSLLTLTQDAANKRLFHLIFPTQTLSGTYNLVIAPKNPSTGVFITDTHGYQVDTNQNAGLDVLRGVTDPTNAVVTRPVYAADPNLAIPASGTVSTTISIPDAFPIIQSLAQNKFIQLELNINDGYIPDLQATLTAPDGKTVVNLFPIHTGDFGVQPFANFANTVFDDSSKNPITLAGSPVTVGPYSPQTPLSVLAGLGSAGKWTLTITNGNADGANKNVAGVLTHWELRLPKGTPTSGLGETVADQIFASFRIFTQASINPQSSTQWTPVGGAANNGGANSGRIGGLAIDPSDPSGNTVFVAGASGGVWKTTNFLTNDPKGPTYISLTDLGPTFSLNIGSIAVFGRNNDPKQSIVFAATGEGDVGSSGVGFLRSMDGGATWQVLDSTVNVDATAQHNILPLSSPLRDHKFVGTTSFKVVVDPTPLADGNVVVYAALSGANGGLWRSVDSGNTWGVVRAGQATDVVLAPASLDSHGNITTLYAAFRGEGVYVTTSAQTTTSLNLMTGGGNPTRVADDLPNQPLLQTLPANGPSPNGAKGRIVLATPALTNNPLQDNFLQKWLYAAVVTTGGRLDGLYLTKDQGTTWTLLNLPAFSTAGALGAVGTAFPTNNETDPSYNPLGGQKFAQGNYDISLAIDPNNPNITYLGGSADGTPLPVSGFIRIDATKVADPYNFNLYSNNEVAGGTQFATAGPTSVGTAPTQGGAGKPYGVLDSFGNYDPAFLNLYREPTDPFGSASTLHFLNVANFNNDGTDVSWMGFNGALGGSTDQHRLLTFRDPLTGRTRLIFGDDQGVWTGVDHGDGTFVSGVGTDNVPIGSRNGNLQITQFYYGASQPSTLAASVAGALFYGEAQDNGSPQSDPNLLANGNLNWVGPEGDGTGVATDPTGSGTLYQYQWPCCIGDTTNPAATPNDFFLVTDPNSTTYSVTQGLILTAAQKGGGVSDDPANGVGEWPFLGGSNFAVNPWDTTGAVVMSSQEGRIFRLTGVHITKANSSWVVIGKPADLDGAYAPAMAFGAPNSNSPGPVDDFIYAGTTAGHIFVTFNGGGAWKNISAGLDGSAVAEIVTNTKFGSHEAYAVTAQGVYWMADSSAAAPTWVKITGNLFSLQKAVFPTAANPNDLQVTLKYLTTIQADWRYAIPDKTGTGTHPILYVGGEGGIFRSRDKGVTWTFFPDVTTDNATQLGGYLPNAHITDLHLVLGNFNPTTGFYDSSAGLNLLVAATYGRGDFAIRLGSPINIDPTSPLFNNIVAPINAPRVIGQSPVLDGSGTLLEGVRLTFAATVDPTTFTAADVVVTDPNGQTVALMADPFAVVDQNPGIDTIFQVNFATPHNNQGKYTITVGPKVYDMSGDQMDQDADNDAGEAADIYTNTFLYQLPTVSTIPNQVVQPGVSDGPIAFTVGDPNYPATALTVTATSNNQAVVADSELVLGGSGANRTITISEAAGTRIHGPANVTVKVVDPSGYTTTTTFTVTDDNPATLNLSPSPDTVSHGTTSSTVQFNGSDPNGDALTYGASLADPLFDLKTQYGVVAEHPEFFDFFGANEKWIAATNAAHGWLLLMPNNTVLNWDGSAHATGALVADLKTGVYSNGSMAVYFNPSLLTQTTGTPLASVPGSYPLYDLRQKYGLGGTAQTFAGYGNAKWIHSSNGSNPGAGGGWFMILPDETLVAWDGVTNHAGGAFVADLNGAVFENTALLTNASVPTVAGATLSNLIQPPGGSVQINATAGFDRSVVLNVTANDGYFTTTAADTFTVNDTAPTVPAVADRVIAHNVGTDSFNLGATDPGDSTGLTYKVDVTGDNPLYDLQVKYGLNMRDIQAFFNSEGAQDKWFLSTNGSNAGVGQGYYFLLPDNTLHAWNGQANTSGPVVADFKTAVYGNADVYHTPGLLYAATPPPAQVVFTQRGPLYDIRKQYGLTTADLPQFFNTEGAQEKWFLSTNGSNPGAGGGYFFLLPNQKLYAWDGTANAKGALIADLSADGDVYHNTALLYQAQPAYNTAAYNASVQFGLDTEEDKLSFNFLGANEKWFHSSNGSNSANGGWYYLKADGTLHQWDGGNADTSPTVVTLPTAAYTDPTLLAGQALAVTATVSNTGQVTLTPNVAFVGTVRITASVSDGAETTTRSFLFTVTDQPPTLAAILPQTGSKAAGSTTVPITAGDPNGDPLTLAATVSAPLYSLRQQYGLNTADIPQFFNSEGANEKWFHSSNGSNDGAGGGYYFLLPDNTLHAWNGQANTSGPVVADFANDPSYGGVSVYNTPAFLYNAQPLPSGVAATFPTSGTVKVTWPTTFTGAIWTTVFVSDGAEEVQQSFLTTVS